MNMMKAEPYQGIVHRYQQRLPVTRGQKIISLNEGNTPLIPLWNLSKNLPGDCLIYVKFEGLNPTGSFKDRGMTLAVTKAVEAGSHAVICASTGNTSAAAAAYAARAGIQAFVLVPEGKIATSKLAQAIVYGAVVIQIQGNFDQGLKIVKRIGEEGKVTIVNSVNPYRLQGQKTAAFEIIETLGRAPDYHCLPVGNAGNITAYWMGYTEYFQDKIIKKRPKMLGFQAAGAAPFVQQALVESPETLATAIRIGKPECWQQANSMQQESAGWFAALTDEEIIVAQKTLATQEGIFCEPASAASIGGLMRDLNAGKIAAGSVIVCTLTGHGLKDPAIVEKMAFAPPIKVAAEYDAVKKIISEKYQ
jgi:threonine synthase